VRDPFIIARMYLHVTFLCYMPPAGINGKQATCVNAIRYVDDDAVVMHALRLTETRLCAVSFLSIFARRRHKRIGKSLLSSLNRRSLIFHCGNANYAHSGVSRMTAGDSFSMFR